MKLFAHYLGALADSAYFDKISLSTSNMPIRVEVRLSPDVAILTT